MVNDKTVTAKTIVLLVITGIGIWFLYSVRNILMPFVVSAMIAYLLFPIVKKIQKTGVKRVVAVSIVYIAFIAIIAIAVYILVPIITYELNNFISNFNDNIAVLKKYITELQKYAGKHVPVLRDAGILDNLAGKFHEFISREISNLPSYMKGLFSVFSTILLVPVITFFYILSGDKIMDKLFELIPSRYVETSLSVFWEIDEVLGRFIRGQILEATIVAVLSSVGLLIINLDYAFLIGIIAGLSNAIPYLGPVVGGTIAAIVGLIQYHNPVIILKVGMVFAIVQFIDNNFIQPIILSKGVNLNPVIVIFAVMAGAEVYGVIGMLLAVPSAGVISTVVGILLKDKKKYI